MSTKQKINDGGPAFPTKCEQVPGMTLREYYAGLAMTGLYSNPYCTGEKLDMASDAVQMADALIDRLDKSQAPAPVSSRLLDALHDLEYYIGNPSAWEHYDDSVSAKIEAVCALAKQTPAAVDAEAILEARAKEEAVMVDQLQGIIDGLAKKIKLMEASNHVLLDELKNIANANTRDWDNPGDFKGWAQSRARSAITAAEKKEGA